MDNSGYKKSLRSLLRESLLKPYSKKESYKVMIVRKGPKKEFFLSTYEIEEDDLVANRVVINGVYTPRYNEFGQTRFMIACSEGKTSLVEASIRKYNAPINDADKDDLTPLMLAVQKGHTEIVQILIFNRAELDYVDTYGNTALMIASCIGNLEIVEILLKSGANFHLIDEVGDTALLMASKKGFYQIVKLIEQYY
jgi:ankyrin repeat protein